MNQNRFDFDKARMATARRTDPGTSHEAAEMMNASGRANTQRRKVFDYVVENPGQTSGEITAGAGLADRYVASRRLPELRRLGFVVNGEARVCRVRGTKQITWKAK